MPDKVAMKRIVLWADVDRYSGRTKLKRPEPEPVNIFWSSEGIRVLIWFWFVLTLVNVIFSPPIYFESTRSQTVYWLLVGRMLANPQNRC